MADQPKRPTGTSYSELGVRKPERVGAPRLADMVIGKVGPTTRQVPPPPPVAVHPPRNQRTLTGVAPPPRGTPAPPVPVPLPAPELDSTLESPPPRSFSPPPMASPREERAIEVEASRHGERVVRNDPAEITPRSGPAPNSWMAKADRVPLWRAVVLITTLCTGISGLVTVLGSEARKLIEAWRPPTGFELSQQIKELRGDVNALVKARDDALETTARKKADEGHDEKLEAVEKRLKQLEREPRVQTVHGLPRE